jgi:inner membrane protein
LSTFAIRRPWWRFLNRPTGAECAKSEQAAGCDIIDSMPSPVGHALGGIAAGVFVSSHSDRRKLALFATVGVLADIDFILPIVHRGPTHSLTAAALAFGGALAVLRWERRPAMSGRLALAIGAAYLTHILFDWLGEDNGPPSGIMALWPFSSDYFVSGLDLFTTVERRYWLPGFWRDNLLAVVREILLLAPVTLISLTLANRAGRRLARRSSETL